jgi:SAM-dependent methyltransferase
MQTVFAPSIITTERVIEYPFVFQNLQGVSGPILDIGCCSSQFPIALASRGFRVVGIDVQPYPYQHPNFRAVRGDAMCFPFPSGCFGAVLAISVVEHIGIGHYGDPTAGDGDEQTVREIQRVLKPGGRALLTMPFGQARTDTFQRVYDPPRLRAVLASLTVERIEYARSVEGLWAPCTEDEAAAVDWAGTMRSVTLVAATNPPG